MGFTKIEILIHLLHSALQKGITISENILILGSLQHRETVHLLTPAKNSIITELLFSMQAISVTLSPNFYIFTSVTATYWYITIYIVLLQEKGLHIYLCCVPLVSVSGTPLFHFKIVFCLLNTLQLCLFLLISSLKPGLVCCKLAKTYIYINHFKICIVNFNWMYLYLFVEH